MFNDDFKSASFLGVCVNQEDYKVVDCARARCCRRPHASCAARPLVLLLVFHNTRIAEMHVRSDGQDGRNCEMHLALIDFIINSLIECEVDRVHPKHRSAIGIVQKTFELCKTKLDATCDWVAG